MDEAVVKEEVIEETCNFTFKNGEYVEVKQEEIEQKPEFLLEQEIKTEPVDLFETNEPDEFFDDFKLKPRERDYEIEKTSTEVNKLKCEICRKRIPKNLLTTVKSEANKTVLAEFFKVKGSLKTRTIYVCISHIQTIIDGYDGTFEKYAGTPFEKRLRKFISTHKKLMKERRDRKTRSRNCLVCHMARECSEVYRIGSKGIRIVIMIGCILRGTHSVEQAKSYITTNNKGSACYSHCKESIDKIFEYLRVRNIQGITMCSTQEMDNLMDIVKKIDSNFKVDQFINACRGLFLKSQKFPSSL
ncbi:hypothetical protein B9Z55_021159 [Caenorhabditis nigoni]|uniref:Lin-15A/B-like domain-containing protein n=1 Tax=Caenorhabditis nigoni TaxID=1611254 RepID=A0A2G5TQQ6_9PELO|nr:hypothetical protein B9Z55_021159 [Caenorhabditis nigoni]